MSGGRRRFPGDCTPSSRSRIALAVVSDTKRCPEPTGAPTRCGRRGDNGHERRMRLYPDIPARRLRTLVRDLLVLVLLVCFALIGLWVHDVFDKLAVLGEGVRTV